MRDASCYQACVAGMGEESGGAISTGRYDPDSIMSYCHNRDAYKTGRPAALSPGDVATLRIAYDQKTVFPREAACKADGHKWNIDYSEGACCLKSEAGKEFPIGDRIYRFCEELQPVGGDPVVIEKSLLIALGKLPFAKPGIGYLECGAVRSLVN